MNIKDAKEFRTEKEQIQRNKIEELAKDTEYYTFFTKGDFNVTDGRICNIITNKDYRFESKWYGSIQHPRYSDKFPNYQIDYDKLEQLEAKSIEEKSTPLLICFFTNELVVWNINKCNWKNTKKKMYVNAVGGKYGQFKEWSYQAYLNLSEAIYRNPNITPFN